MNTIEIKTLSLPRSIVCLSRRTVSTALRYFSVVAIMSLVASCAFMPGSSLKPTTGSPSQVTITTPQTVVNRGKPDFTTLPAGTYKLIGENERGVFYVGPGLWTMNYGVFTSVNTSAGTSQSYSTLSKRIQYGLVIPKQDFVGKQATVRAFWTGTNTTWSDTIVPNTPGLYFKLKSPFQIQLH